jgi:hypothetical protein
MYLTVIFFPIHLYTIGDIQDLHNVCISTSNHAYTPALCNKFLVTIFAVVQPVAPIKT